MRLLIISPVTQTDLERDEEERYIQSLMGDQVEVELKNIHFGFPSVESDLSHTVNAAELIVELLRRDLSGVDGVFINCFDDPGVTACREALEIPVFGGYVPSMLTAMSLGERIGVITTDPSCIANEERKARAYGFDRRLVEVGCASINVVDLLNDPRKLMLTLADECERLHKDARVDVICLGCTVMSRVWKALQAELKHRGCSVYVVEPMITGLYWLKNSVELGYSNSFHLGHTLEAIRWNQK